MIAQEHVEHGPLLRLPQLPSELEGRSRRECDEGGRLSLAGRGRQHVRLCDQEAQAGCEAWALRAGHAELANVLSGDIRVGTHVDDVDALHVVDPLQVLDGQGDHFLRDMRLTQPRLVGHEKAP